MHQRSSHAPRRLRCDLRHAAVGVLVLASGCMSQAPRVSGHLATLQVVATTTQLADFATVVGGDRVSVYDVLRANVDPHDFEPSPADLDAIAKAAVIVKNGVGLERWFGDVVEAASPQGEIVDASSGVAIRRGGADESEGDPHIWNNPQNAKTMVSNIAAAFVRADEVHAAEYRTRAASYDRQLDALDIEIRTKIDRLTNKKLVTNHDAFGYFVAHYGMTFVGSIIPSFDTSAELSASELADLVGKIKMQHVRAVFSETSLPRKTADAIASEAGVKVVAGANSLYGDTLGPTGSDNATYLGMMRHNADVIVAGLQ